MFSSLVENNVILKPYTTFKIGGKADFFAVVKTQPDLIKIIIEAQQNRVPYFILGNGSNILVADTGYRGLAIKLELNNIAANNNEVTAEAGATLGTLLGFCKDHGLSGLEFLSGIPATIGGAIWGNIGSTVNSISTFIKTVTILNENNELQTITGKDCGFSYRDSIFKKKNYIILAVVFSLKLEKSEVIEKNMQITVQKKIQNQDLSHPSAGSVFKNPEQHKAWELIEKAGMRGYQIGGAKVSEKHANFIINTGNATASDVIILISLIKQKVRDNLGVQLMEEIKYIGF